MNLFYNIIVIVLSIAGKFIVNFIRQFSTLIDKLQNKDEPLGSANFRGDVFECCGISFINYKYITESCICQAENQNKKYMHKPP